MIWEMLPWFVKRRLVFERDRYICQYCGSNMDLAVDHIWPRSKGGTDDLNNLMTACGSCNSSKNGRTLREWIDFKVLTSESFTNLYEKSEEYGLAGTDDTYPFCMVVVDGKQIPLSFAKKFVFEDGTDTNLASIRQYGEGSKERKWAGILTNYLIKNEYARKLGGPYPAQWMDRAQGIKSLELDRNITVTKEDPLLDRAIEIVNRRGKGSISMLQAEMSIGFPRASRLVFKLEEIGVLRKSNGMYRELISENVEDDI